MGNLVRTVGNGTYLPMIKRSTGILSDGSAVMMVADHNQANVTGDGGDGTGIPKLHFYHSTDRVNWTLKATVTYSTTYAAAVASMCVDSANNIHVTYRGSSQTAVWYAKLTYAAGPAWTVNPGVQVSAGLAGYNATSILDIDTIGNSVECVVIGAYWYQTTGAKKTAVQTYARSTAGAWAAHAEVVAISGDSHLGYSDDLTVAGDNIGGLTGASGFFAFYVTRKGANGTDYGDLLYITEVNTTSGAWVSRKLIQGGIYKGYGGGFRKFWLFNTAANQYTLAGVVNTTPMQTAVYRFTYVRASATFTSQTPVSVGPSQGTDIIRASNNHNWCAAAYNSDGMIYFFANNGQSIVATARVESPNVTYRPGWSRWDNGYGNSAGTWDSTGKFSSPTVAPLEQILSGATRNWAKNRIDALMFHHRASGSPQSFRMESRSLLLPLAPWGVTPASSSTVSTDRPTLSANHKMQMYYAQIRSKMEWQVAADAGFTTNLRTISDPWTDGEFILADGTSSPYNKVAKSSEAIPAVSELTQGTWYIRARTQDIGDNFGPYSSSQAFTITHPPVGADLYPTSGAVFLYAGAGNVTFTWKFTDPSPYDSQSAYRVVIENANDGTIILDSGKVVSTVQSATLAVPIGGKDTDLRWKLTLWDSDDVQGPDTSYQAFYVTDPPAPVITAPADGAVLSSGIPTISWTSGIGGTKVQAKYRVLLTQGVNVIYNSQWIDSAGTSYTLPVGYLSNDQQYTIRVELQDNLGLQGVDEIAVSADWVEPIGPADDWEVYLSEYAKRGFVYITWTDANMDADFSSWNLYRRQRGDATWTQIATVTSGAGRYAYRDYFIGSGRTYEYTITQMVDRFGDRVESVPTKIVRVSPDADNYWLIDPLVPSQSIPLYQVTADPFSEEYEQETIQIIGAGRHVEYGDRLGYAGEISSQLRDKFLSGTPRENYALNPAMSYQSINGAVPDGWLLTPNAQFVNFSDLFTRTVVDGLGTGWTTSGGAATNYDVDGTKAIVSMTAKGIDYYMIPTMTSLDDFDVTFLTGSPDMTADAASNNPQISFWARYVDANNNLRVKVWLTGAGLTLNLTQIVGGVTTTSAGFISIPGTTINTQVWIRVQGIADAIKVAGWANGGSQTSTWQIEFTTTLLSAGGMRVSGTMPAAYSGTVPKTFTLDSLTINSVPTIGEVSSEPYETQNPSPSGKTPYRVYVSGLGPDTSDSVRLEGSIKGADFPDKMKIPGTTVVLSVWAAVSALNTNKRYRLSVSWLDAAGGQQSQVDSAPLDPVLDGVESYISPGSLDAQNATQVWRRIKLQTVVPSTVPAGATLKIRLMGNGGAVSPGELILGGVQFEADQMTPYFDGDQFGAAWSGTPYLSYSYGTGYYTARQQRQALERIKARKTWVYLRNPFGDLWKVAPGDISTQRISGVGKSELVDVSMPYQEVGF